MAIEPKEYFLFIHDDDTATTGQSRRRIEGFPDASTAVMYTNGYRMAITATLNRAFQDGVQEAFPFLPTLLAGTYGSAILRDVFDIRALIVWRKLSPSQRRRHNAQYSIAFHIPATRPQAAIHLAYFLMSFTYSAIRAYVTTHYNYDVARQPCVKGLAYHLHPSGSTGIVFYDYIDDVFDAATENKPLYPQYQASSLAGLTVSTWPPYESSLLQEAFVTERYLYSLALGRS
ncbi:hypothetical protein C2E23DRAFT_859607 [Lenzites betulinus]|nr:hypothetical protein C2E23DRAFT_859607 [Lenzites betulinus]